jgi:hypothetical protein
LTKEKEEKETEIKILIGKSINQLWQEDLDEFLAQWDKFESDMADQESTRPDQVPGKGGKKSKALNLKKPKKKSLEDFDVSMDEDDDDFMPKTKKITKPAAVISGFSFLSVWLGLTSINRQSRERLLSNLRQRSPPRPLQLRNLKSLQHLLPRH